MIEWTGVLAHLDTPTEDGRVLQNPERLLSRPLPLPLFLITGEPAGSITHLRIHADQLHAEGTLRDGLLTPDRPTLPVALDADDCAFHSPPGGGVIFTQWRVTGATLLLEHGARAPWPQALIRAKETTP